MVLNKYATFVRVAENKNLTKVANELNYTQSAISHAIQGLENEIGLPLIHRTKNGIKLTQYGEELLPDFRRVVSAEAALLQKADEFRGMQRGTLHIGAFTSVSYHWIPYIARKIADEYPNVTFTQSHGSYEGVYDDIVHGRVDIGFLTEKSKRDLDFIPLYEDEYILVMPEDHPYANYEKMPLAALEDSTIILMKEGGDSDSMDIVREIPGGKVSHWVNEDMLAIPLVEQGIGIAILPKLIVDNIKTSAVIKEFTTPMRRMIGVAAKSFSDISPLAQLFIKLTKEFLEEWQPDQEIFFGK